MHTYLSSFHGKVEKNKQKALNESRINNIFQNIIQK